MDSIGNLPAFVRDRFDTARKDGALTFYDTQVSVLRCHGIPFQVRYSPALANKPKSNKPRDPKAKPFDPFADPSADLFITELPSHFLVLNKFPINPHHFILATKEYKEQTHMLEEDDIEAAYACLKKYSQAGEELFGFFNSGEHSGASQTHRHIQFLPVESMQSGMRASDEWNVLADNLAKKPNLPFTYFWSAISEDIAAQQLYSIYLELHKKAVQSMGISVLSSNHETASPISYNLAITNKGMVVCPRTSEGITITSTKGEQIGPVALNGTLLAGTLLVKSEAEWDTLRNDESMLIEILSSIGVSSIKKDTRI